MAGQRTLGPRRKGRDGWQMTPLGMLISWDSPAGMPPLLKGTHRNPRPYGSQLLTRMSLHLLLISKTDTTR